MKKIFLIAFYILITGCVSNSDHTSPIPDPFEKINRSTHEFNKSIDSTIVAPASEAYGSLTPESIRNILSNFYLETFKRKYIINRNMHNTFILAVA